MFTSAEITLKSKLMPALLKLYTAYHLTQPVCYHGESIPVCWEHDCCPTNCGTQVRFLIYLTHRKQGNIHHITLSDPYMVFGLLVPWPHFLIQVKLCTSRLCMIMSSFLYACTCAMPRMLHSTCWIPFPVWTHDNISGLISVVPWLSRWEVIKKCHVVFS